MSARADIALKRVYDPPADDDGLRVLVERLWPRGMTKDEAAIDHWLKDVSPSRELRKWFGHQPERWDEFRRRYEAEIAGNPAALETLRGWCEEGRVTFVFAARDRELNSAVILRDFLIRDSG